MRTSLRIELAQRGCLFGAMQPIDDALVAHAVRANPYLANKTCWHADDRTYVRRKDKNMTVGELNLVSGAVSDVRDPRKVPRAVAAYCDGLPPNASWTDLPADVIVFDDTGDDALCALARAAIAVAADGIDAVLARAKHVLAARPDLRRALLDTSSAVLVFRDTGGVWGCVGDDHVGLNRLGRICMQMRFEAETCTWPTFFRTDPGAIDLIRVFAAYETAVGATIVPSVADIVDALDGGALPRDVRVVIMGRAPYRRDGVACGLPFATKGNLRTDTLYAFAQELSITEGARADVDVNACLRRWVRDEGVLLLNVSPTFCRCDARAEHRDAYLCDHRDVWAQVIESMLSHVGSWRLPAILMGDDAHAYKYHFAMVVTTALPTTRRARRKSPPPFVGSRAFHSINAYLSSAGVPTVRWI